MKSCPFVFFQACSLSVNTLTLHKMIISEADGFHYEGVMFLHSPVMGELKNAMRHTHACMHAQVYKHTYIHRRTSTIRFHSDRVTLPERSGVDIFSVLKGSLSQNNGREKHSAEIVKEVFFWLFVQYCSLQRFESPEL